MTGATAVALTAACASGGSDSGAAGATISVTEPMAGATVSVPFTVKVTSSVPLGTTESGLHHVHIWFDNQEDRYQMAFADTIQVTDAPSGSHTMTVSLRNADHSDAGPRTQVVLTINGGSGSPAPPEYDYGY